MNNDGIGFTPYAMVCRTYGAGIAYCSHRVHALCWDVSHLRCLVGVFFLSEE